MPEERWKDIDRRSFTNTHAHSCIYSQSLITDSQILLYTNIKGHHTGTN